MTTEIWAAVLLIAAPLWFNGTFALLAKRFDYPDILRRPTEEILERFWAGGSSLILLWWAFMLSGLLMIAAVVLLSQALGYGGVLPIATIIGVLAGLVQMLGLLRWVYLVPSLARAHADPRATEAVRQTTIAIFQAFHRYLGAGVGEHLGYVLTGTWSILVGIAIILGSSLPTWLGWPGIVIGAGLVVSSAEFLGPNEERGWSFAGAAIPVPTSRGPSGCWAWGSPWSSDPAEPPRARILAAGGVRAPGGPPGLQNRCAGDELAGGFDSRPPPLSDLVFDLGFVPPF